MYLRQHNALSRVALEAAVKAAYRPGTLNRPKSQKDNPGLASVNVLHRDRAANISDWLNPHITDFTRTGGASKWMDHRQFRV